MSSNDALVIITNEDGSGTTELWHDYCVDNPFPVSAQKVGTFGTLAEAAHEASQICTEYGVSFLKGPVPSVPEDWLEQEEEADRLTLVMDLERGACPHCSSLTSRTFHGISTEGCRDPGRPYNYLSKGLGERLPGIDAYRVAREVLEILATNGVNL